MFDTRVPSALVPGMEMSPSILAVDALIFQALVTPAPVGWFITTGPFTVNVTVLSCVNEFAVAAALNVRRSMVALTLSVTAAPVGIVTASVTPGMPPGPVQPVQIAGLLQLPPGAMALHRLDGFITV